MSYTKARKRKLVVALGISTGLLCSGMASATTIDFNNSADLANNFNGVSPFTNGTNNGLSGTGAVGIPLGSNAIVTFDTGTTLFDGGTYSASAYFYYAANSGYGEIGFATADTNALLGTYPGKVENSLGMTFHGGGGAFESTVGTANSKTNVTWGNGDIALANWYKFTYVLTSVGANVFNADFLVQNSDAAGVLGTERAHKTLTGITNTAVGGASTLYAYFGNSGSRVTKMDNFETITVGAPPAPPPAAPVPEPATMLLMGTGLFGLIGARRKKQA